MIPALLFAFGCGELARQKGRDPILWALLGFFFGLIPLIVIIVADSKTYSEDVDLDVNLGMIERETEEAGKISAVNNPTTDIQFNFDGNEDPYIHFGQENAKRDRFIRIRDISLILGIIGLALLVLFLIK